MQTSQNTAAQAAIKMETGALMRVSEVSAIFDISPATVHSLPLSSVRIGRSLRFDPRDVRAYIELCKEPVLAKGGRK